MHNDSDSAAAADEAEGAGGFGGTAADPGVSGLISDLRRLAGDAKTLAQAELAYQASRAAVAGGAARSIAVYGAAAAALAVFALGALTIGLLLALTPLVGPWGATAIVAGGLALAALACVKLASRRWNRAKAALIGGDAAGGDMAP